MDLKYTPEQQAFRAQVRAFLEAELPADIRARAASGKRLLKDDLTRWQNSASPGLGRASSATISSA